MKVFVAGATGVIGHRAVRLLVDAGHDVTAVARSDEKAKLVAELGATPARVDIFDADALADAVVGHEVVMNLATHIPAPSRAALRSGWKENDRIRSAGSRNLVDAAVATGATRYIQESIAFTYQDRGSELIDEDVPLDLGPNVLSVADAEANAARFTANGGAGVVLRFGAFYGPGASSTDLQISAARRGFSTFLGDLGDYMSPIHLDDAASAVVAALDAPAGTYNITDDEPLTRRELDDAMAHAVGRERLRRMPKGIVRAGGPAMRMLLRSQRVSNARFKRVTGWSPRFGSARDGLSAVLG